MNYYFKNREERLKYQKEYYLLNIDKYRKYNKEYYKKNFKKICENKKNKRMNVSRNPNNIKFSIEYKIIIIYFN